MKNKLKNRNILVLSPSEWSDNAVSNMHISSQLSLENKVVYLETIGGRFPKLSEIGRVFRRIVNFFGSSRKHKIQKGLDPNNVIIESPLAIPIYNSPILDKINKKILNFQIKKILKKNNFSNIIIWCFSPRWEGVINELDYNILIFHCVDALNTYDSSNEFYNKFKRIVKKSDIVLTPSKLLEKDLKKINHRTKRIPHGCDDRYLDSVFKIENSAELSKIKKPIAIYVGTLANWVDYNLLIDVVSKNKKISFVLIGYIHALAPKNKITKLLNFSNVYHLGYKKFEFLSNYIRMSDVCIVPYDQTNKHIQYSTPTKFLDYLASGLPIISTSFPDAYNYKDMIYIAKNAIKFSKCLDIATAEKSKSIVQKRKNFAKQNAWSTQISKMEMEILNIIN